MKNTVENNLEKWDSEHSWSKDGDEWSGQARLCGQPYKLWKQSLVDTFIKANISGEDTILEIGPGHGRWSKEIVDHCGQLILVDLGPKCIDFCRDLLQDKNNVQYRVNDGQTLPEVDDSSVDFIWSYDAFVHMNRATIESYFGEIRRVLKPGRKAIIHHAGRRHAFLWLRFLRETGAFGSGIYKYLTVGRLKQHDGWRADVSRTLVRAIAKKQGLIVEDQVNTWGQQGEFGIPAFFDAITILTKPGS
ncbi:MAG: class I SAM-dependent methyltransferase [Planctomycetota bacterium]|nr:class I SAM-dependent methyltransferase [Planctomycetota bacterium]